MLYLAEVEISHHPLLEFFSPPSLVGATYKRQYEVSFHFHFCEQILSVASFAPMGQLLDIASGYLPSFFYEPPPPPLNVKTTHTFLNVISI